MKKSRKKASRRKLKKADAVAKLQGQPVLIEHKANPSRYSRPAKF